MPLQVPERLRTYLFPLREVTHTADEICGLSDRGSGALLAERSEIYALTQPFSILPVCKFACDAIKAKRVARFSSNLAEMFLDGTKTTHSLKIP
ncbi:hypothetical protein AVEN_64866-1 [Araneus ventricosus]|uniref:Uncharacterized protein n=1 Tax=Araneus ventricosus TaxID=182803 RepID=A0A4Y2DDS8_ARAVE|nr:hypothetical protein AVEN_64866-1 [Araneus ventricosus]